MINRNLKLCRSKLNFKAPVVLGIHSTHATDEADYIDGHAWITVETPSERVYLGLWPDGHPRVVNNKENCTDVRLGLEMGIRPVASRYYQLNSTQVSALNAIVNRPDTWGYTNTCADWASTVVEDVLGVDIDAIDYAIFATPRELGKHIVKLESKSPTSPQFPNTNPAADHMKGSL